MQEGEKSMIAPRQDDATYAKCAICTMVNMMGKSKATS